MDIAKSRNNQPLLRNSSSSFDQELNLINLKLSHSSANTLRISNYQKLILALVFNSIYFILVIATKTNFSATILAKIAFISLAIDICLSLYQQRYINIFDANLNSRKKDTLLSLLLRATIVSAISISLIFFKPILEWLFVSNIGVTGIVLFDSRLTHIVIVGLYILCEQIIRAVSPIKQLSDYSLIEENSPKARPGSSPKHIISAANLYNHSNCLRPTPERIRPVTRRLEADNTNTNFEHQVQIGPTNKSDNSAFKIPYHRVP